MRSQQAVIGPFCDESFPRPLSNIASNFCDY